MLDSVVKVSKKVLPLIHFWKNANMKLKRPKQRHLLFMIQTQVDLIMKLLVTLIMRLDEESDNDESKKSDNESGNDSDNDSNE